MTARPQLKLLQALSAGPRVARESKLDEKELSVDRRYAEYVIPIPDAPPASRVTAANHPFEFAVTNKLALPGNEVISSGAGDNLRRARLFRRRSARN